MTFQNPFPTFFNLPLDSEVNYRKLSDFLKWISTLETGVVIILGVLTAVSVISLLQLMVVVLPIMLMLCLVLLVLLFYLQHNLENIDQDCSLLKTINRLKKLNGITAALLSILILGVICVVFNFFALAVLGDIVVTMAILITLYLILNFIFPRAPEISHSNQKQRTVFELMLMPQINDKKSAMQLIAALLSFWLPGLIFTHTTTGFSFVSSYHITTFLIAKMVMMLKIVMVGFLAATSSVLNAIFIPLGISWFTFVLFSFLASRCQNLLYQRLFLLTGMVVSSTTLFAGILLATTLAGLANPVTAAIIALTVTVAFVAMVIKISFSPARQNQSNSQLAVQDSGANFQKDSTDNPTVFSKS